MLAQRFGIPIPEMERAASSARPPRSAKRSSRFTKSRARISASSSRRPAGARWREYLLKERGLTQETIDRLQIGWAPPARDALRQRLLKAGFSPIQMVTSGLVTRRDDGTELDRFRNRLMIPIARDTGP